MVRQRMDPSARSGRALVELVRKQAEDALRKSEERSFRWVACAAALVAATLSLAAACKQVELASVWATDGVEVDGVNDEWIGAITYFEKQDVTVGLLNGDEFLYVSLVTSSPARRRWRPGR